MWFIQLVWVYDQIPANTNDILSACVCNLLNEMASIGHVITGGCMMAKAVKFERKLQKYNEVGLESRINWLTDFLIKK